MSRIIWRSNLLLDKQKNQVCQLLQRFINRLHYEKPFDFYVNNLIVNENATNNKNHKALQLYYSTLYQDETQIKNRLKSINKTSIFDYFYLRHMYSSAHGYDSHLYAHSRFSYMLGRYNVFICDVEPNEEYISRYVSEIYSPKNNNTYVIKDNRLITPKIYFVYEIKPNIHKDILSKDKLFTNSQIDNRVCFPIIDNNDIV
jgi:hypothetical protein